MDWSDFTVPSPVSPTHFSFGHVAWPDDDTPAPHKYIIQPTSWPHVCHPPGCPWNNWLDQFQNDSTHPSGDLWRQAVGRGHGDAIAWRTLSAMQPWWWWWWRGNQLTQVPLEYSHQNGNSLLLSYSRSDQGASQQWTLSFVQNACRDWIPAATCALSHGIWKTNFTC